MNNKHLLTIILVIGVGVGGFFAGMKYQQSRQPSGAHFQTRGGVRRLRMPAGQQKDGSQVIRGKIISQDKGSVTIKLPDGSSKLIFISKNTTINKTTQGSVDDLETGKQIIVFGQENSDKSISATNIQLDFGFRKGPAEKLTP